MSASTETWKLQGRQAGVWEAFLPHREAGMGSAFLRERWESVIVPWSEPEHDSPESPLGTQWGFRFLELSASNSGIGNMSAQSLPAWSFLLPPLLLFRPYRRRLTESSFCCFVLRFLVC